MTQPEFIKALPDTKMWADFYECIPTSLSFSQVVIRKELAETFLNMEFHFQIGVFFAFLRSEGYHPVLAYNYNRQAWCFECDELDSYIIMSIKKNADPDIVVRQAIIKAFNA